MGREPTDGPRPDHSRTEPQAGLSGLGPIGGSRLSGAEARYARRVLKAIPAGAGCDTTLSRPAGFFMTPDSTPTGLSATRSRWVAPLLLLLFTAGAAAVDKWV